MIGATSARCQLTMLRDGAADETLRTERRTALVSPLDKPLEQANGEDSQEEPDQEVSEIGGKR